MATPLTGVLDEVEHLFAEFLKERGQRQTPERFAVLKALYESDGHLDADSLYSLLRSGGIRVSRATVYNTLELLTECRLVERHQFGNRQAKYERAYGFRQHDHLLCLDCNEVFEFCDPRLQSVQEMVSEVLRFEINHHSLHLYGHCRRDACPNLPAAGGTRRGVSG